MLTRSLDFDTIRTRLSPPLLITGLMFFSALVFLLINSPEFLTSAPC
jgi:hypothetical protein